MTWGLFCSRWAKIRFVICVNLSEEFSFKMQPINRQSMIEQSFRTNKSFLSWQKLRSKSIVHILVPSGKICRLTTQISYQMISELLLSKFVLGYSSSDASRRRSAVDLISIRVSFFFLYACSFCARRHFATSIPIITTLMAIIIMLMHIIGRSQRFPHNMSPHCAVENGMYV